MAKQSGIFISHSMKDAELAASFLELFILGAEVEKKRIFCSSYPGTDLPLGEYIVEGVRKGLDETAVFIALITPNYPHSIFAVAELGAGWVITENVYPLVVPPVTYKDIDGVLTGKLVASIESATDLSKLRDHISKDLGLTETSTPAWEAGRNRFLERLPEILGKLPVPDSVERKTYEELGGKYKESLKTITQLQSQIAESSVVISKLKGLKDKDEVSEVMAESSNEREHFEALVNAACEALGKIPLIAQEALFYNYYGRPFRPGSERNTEIESALENGYVNIGDERGWEIEANLDDPGVSVAYRNVGDIGKFLVNEASAEFAEWYEDTYEHPPDLKNRRFWVEHLFSDYNGW
jgi:hypothetical protein